MDHLNVPKKYNRHVLNALFVLNAKKNSSDYQNVENIKFQVEKQMRHGNTNGLEFYVPKSLSNLTNLGLLVCSGESNYALHLNSPGPTRANKRKSDGDEIFNINRKKSRKIAKTERKKLNILAKPMNRKTVKKNECVCSECHRTVLEMIHSYGRNDIDVDCEASESNNKSYDQVNQTESIPVACESSWNFADPWYIMPTPE